MVVVSPVFIKYFTPKGTIGITIFPLIIIKSKYRNEIRQLILHEKIHFRQQMEMLVLFFYIWYGIEFAIKWIRYKNFNLAYRNISFEQEAYSNENNLKYLRNRNFWNFIHYL